MDSFVDNFMNSNFDEEGDLMPLITLEEEDEQQIQDILPDDLPILALKNTVLFPGNVIPITVGRDKSLKAVNLAYESHRTVAVFAQKDGKIENPVTADLHHVGTIARIIKLIRMQDGTTTAILQGRKRCQLEEVIREEPQMEGRVSTMEYKEPSNSMEFEAIISSIIDKARNIIDLSPNIPSEAMLMLKNINSKTFLLNFISSNLGVKVQIKQNILEENDLQKKSEIIIKHMDNELQLLELKDQIENKVRTDLEKQQREYFLNQQMKTIQEELGQNPHEEEIRSLEARAQKKKWPETVAKTFQKELNRVKRTNPQMADYALMINYLEVLLDLPWSKFSKDNFNLKKVQQVLDNDHYGLEKVKDRIMEHLAVLKLKGDMKAPIICLVGPPGVGKTSLGKSVANALGRKFIRMSLGGLHDESEIRGHRKTYIGAMPGRIIQSMKKAGTSNPVFILDEIDKVGRDFRGDPSSALLEVLDPEQNTSFQDNYLELEYDLSKVMFIATANSLSSIQPALLDRMEIIHISGYSMEEKVEIAKRHLVPSQRKEHGLTAKDIKLSDKVILQLIQDYTRESGVRSLDRRVAGVMRAVAKRVAMEETYNVSVKTEDLKDLIGPARFTNDAYEDTKIPGVVVGLAWTSVGGDILYIEASSSKGKGNLTLTGNLGDVMKESATTALSWIKANAEKLKMDSAVFEERNIHIHVPEGAIPKDGPSAGVTMLTALVSAFTDKPVIPHLAMTGEITLRGKVLPVGGIKEKVLAAKRAGVKHIILCKENEKDILEINQDFLSGLQFHYVSRMEEVLDIAIDTPKVKKTKKA